MSFEKDVATLEKLVQKLDENLSIDDSLKIFNEALLLSKTCIDELKLSRGKLELLTKELEKINLDVDIENE